ncbi:MAG TPA: A24 family peptidase [Anaerovoracaceae bacterium]|nr:A24 family peptidase [Anaerovoracaceae bacterium]
MTLTLITIIKCLAAILVALFAGNGAVYFFNKMPGKWLVDYGQEPDEELAHPTVQRIRSYPWKYVFTIFFVIIAIKMVMWDYRFAAAAIIAVWTLLEMSIADIKYRIVPDQLIMVLAVSALGFIPFHNSWKDCIFGALIGFGVMFLVALIGKLAYKKEALGGGDIKLFAALGLVLGVGGVIGVFIMSTILSAAHFVILLIMKKIKKDDTMPMVPYIAAAATIYLVLLWTYGQVIYL